MTKKSLPTSNRRLLLSLCLMVGAGFALSGCGAKEPPRGRIAGKVTFQGKAVSEGLVLFSNKEKGIHINAALKPDGSYEVVTAKAAGLPTGEYQVCVSPPLVEKVTGKGPQPKPKTYDNIPLKYRDFQTSGLTLNVKQGENPFDIAM